MLSPQDNSPSRAINSGQAKHLRNIDKDIRKKWQQLYFHRQHTAPREQDSSVSGKKINTEPSSHSPPRVGMDPHSVQLLKSNQHR
jgi:hypothetical protein